MITLALHIYIFDFLVQSCSGTGDHGEAICKLEEAHSLAQKEWVGSAASAYSITTVVCQGEQRHCRAVHLDSMLG